MSNNLFSLYLVKISFQNQFLYAVESINRNMDFYEKYKSTIKNVSKRHYNKRIIWLNEYLANYSCPHCGESETACLKFYPHDSKIRSLSKRKGLNKNSRDDVIKLIDSSKIVCSNCYIKLENDIIELI
jgi:predicted RNA-binding Zn-ribbon protein involved in translation (DUF1610 family)|tara:strand:- start:216 stop:599 length:384 start_codon:yes stop_codon:yes gene_type:complete